MNAQEIWSAIVATMDPELRAEFAGDESWVIPLIEGALAQRTDPDLVALVRAGCRNPELVAQARADRDKMTWNRYKSFPERLLRLIVGERALSDTERDRLLLVVLEELVKELHPTKVSNALLGHKTLVPNDAQFAPTNRKITEWAEILCPQIRFGYCESLLYRWLKAITWPVGWKEAIQEFDHSGYLHRDDSWSKVFAPLRFAWVDTEGDLPDIRSRLWVASVVGEGTGRDYDKERNRKHWTFTMAFYAALERGGLSDEDRDRLTPNIWNWMNISSWVNTLTFDSTLVRMVQSIYFEHQDARSSRYRAIIDSVRGFVRTVPGYVERRKNYTYEEDIDRKLREGGASFAQGLHLPPESHYKKFRAIAEQQTSAYIESLQEDAEEAIESINKDYARIVASYAETQDITDATVAAVAQDPPELADVRLLADTLEDAGKEVPSLEGEIAKYRQGGMGGHVIVSTLDELCRRAGAFIKIGWGDENLCNAFATFREYQAAGLPSAPPKFDARAEVERYLRSSDRLLGTIALEAMTGKSVKRIKFKDFPWDTKGKWVEFDVVPILRGDGEAVHYTYGKIRNGWFIGKQVDGTLGLAHGPTGILIADKPEFADIWKEVAEELDRKWPQGVTWTRDDLLSMVNNDEFVAVAVKAGRIRKKA